MAWWLVGIGGMIGSIMRYSLYVMMQHGWQLPPYISTILVNILGSFLIGMAAVWVEHTAIAPDITAHMRLLLMTGLLGGFTTFSTFSLDALTLLQQGRLSHALLYMFVSCVLGIISAYLGMRLMRGLAL
ncbi:MAG: fluoride efflux transporter CrcB [Sphaerospermopsis sp. SIO1G2]|nr:fluoride efflux transporter CrcB [Sphaerospermopsis sp. SIO1G2]